MPPPAYCGARSEPWRARPVPFWRYGFLPPPRTSPRLLVLCVPWRAAASWATTTWWISATLVFASKIDSGSSTVVPAVTSSGPCTVSERAISCPLRGGSDDHEAALGARDRALDE